MGSNAFKARELPVEVKEGIDEAIKRGMMVIVGEAPGASRLYQDYLQDRDYRNVVVGHSVRLRCNAGNRKTIQYRKDLKEGERKMIKDCDSAVVVWMNNTEVIEKTLNCSKD